MPANSADTPAMPGWHEVRAGMERVTEAIAHELAQPVAQPPPWGALEWRLAMAMATAHGVAPLLSAYPGWPHGCWQTYLAGQRMHVEARHQRLLAQLEAIDSLARERGIPLVPLKGAALHALDVYAPGERPMADLDLLIDPADESRVGDLLQRLGYELSMVVWKHRVYRIPQAFEPSTLGEHRDAAITIEVHTSIQERLPMHVVDLSSRVRGAAQVPGINAYASVGALLCHLLLHLAGNMCTRTVRLIHVHDISRLAALLQPHDWDVLLEAHRTLADWWAVPPLRLVERYFAGAVPRRVLDALEPRCPRRLRPLTTGAALTRLSCSAVWPAAFPGWRWTRSTGEAMAYVSSRLHPDAEARRERKAMLRTQAWLQDHSAHASMVSRAWSLLAHTTPRADTRHLVRLAFGAASPQASGEQLEVQGLESSRGKVGVFDDRAALRGNRQTQA
ncbi:MULTISPECIES: nucleotidyltransferase family protein [Dyella]|nr:MULTISPECIES: nucleotidyltransferase family protein [Dyella]